MILIAIEENKSYGACAKVHYNLDFKKKEDGTLLDYHEILTLMNAEIFDICDIGYGIDMWVDEKGLFKDKIEPNWIAQALRAIYWAQNSDILVCPCKYPPICGSVVLLGHNDKGDAVDLTDAQVAYIKSIIAKRDCSEV